MFSKACEYGIRAAIFIALQSQQGERASLKDISAEIDSPVAFTSKILQQLVKSKIITSVKGSVGGFEIEPGKLEEIKLSQIVSSIDGNQIYVGCGLGLKNCSEIKPCPLHDKFKKIREDLRYMLESTSLFELSQGLKTGDTFLKNLQLLA